jgi:hypothetical protein
VGEDSTEDVSGEVKGVPTLLGAVSESLRTLRPSELVLEAVEDRPRGYMSGAL